MTNKHAQTGFRKVVGRELDRMLSRPIYLFITFVLPLASFLLFGTFFGNGVLRDLPVAVYDADESSISQKLLQQLEVSPSIRFSAKVKSVEQGHQLIESGQAMALFVIPANFQQQTLRSESPDVVLYYSNLSLAAGSTISTAAQTIVGTVSAGINLQKRQLNKQMREQAMAQIQPIQVDSHSLFNPYMSYTYYLSSGLMPIMLQMFVLISVIYGVGLELKESTALAWYQAAGNDISKAILGKLLPYSVIFIVMGLFMNSLLFDHLQVPMNGNRLLTDFALVLMIIAYQAIGLTLVFATANLRLSISFGAGYGAMAFSFSGIAFPIDAMSGFFQGFSNVFPFKFYWLSFVDQAFRAAPVALTGEHLLVLNLFILLPLLVIPRAKRVVQNPVFWGKL